MDLAIRIVVPLLVAVAGFVPLLNFIRKRRGEDPLHGIEARRAFLRFAAVFVPLGVLIIVGAELLYD